MIFVGMALIVAVALAFLITSDAGSLIGLEQNDFGQLVILVAVLLLVAGGSFGRRIRFNEMISGVILWAGIFALAIFGYSFRTELEQYGSRFLSELKPGTAYISEDGASARFTRSLGGSFVVTGNVNGANVQFVFDTGATAVVLTVDDAQRAGIDVSALRFSVPVSTANGEAFAAQTRVAELTVGGIKRENVTTLVAEQGRLERSLLGMTFLETLSSFTVAQDTLELRD